MLNLWSSSIARRACAANVGLAHQRVALMRPSLCSPIFFPLASVSRHCSTTSISSSLSKVDNSFLDREVTPIVPPTPPPVAVKKHHKIAEKVKEEFHRVINGSKLLGQNTKTAALLLHSMTKGNILTRREKALMITTLADLIRMVPFIVILLIPFAEFALPVLLKVFPNMLPSTFTSASQKEISRAKKLQAKLKVLEILQAASENLVLRGKLDSKENRESLVNFMAKVSRGEDIQVDEVLKISNIFRHEFSLESLDRQQLISLVKFFGLPALGTNFFLQESLKFRWNLLVKDDAHILKDGIDSLTPSELEEAALSRGFSHSNTHQDQRQYIQEWIVLSQANVPPYLLLLSRAHLAKNVNRVTDITPPVITPFIPAISSAQSPFVEPTLKVGPIYIPEKDIVPLEFKNISHEFSYNPVVTKLWERIARFTSDLKKETFSGRQDEVIHLGDASADKFSTVITSELRRYLQAMFIALDKNGDRKLSIDEVEHGLNASDIPVQRAEVISLVQQHDQDKDNHLSFDEFVDCILYMRKNRND